MKKWEYKILDLGKVPCNPHKESKFHEDEDIEDYFNQIGDWGWEIVNIDFFIRERGERPFTGLAKREKKNGEGD